MALDDSLGERMAGVGAGIFECEELVPHAKDADFDAAHEHAQSGAGHQITSRAHAYKRHRVSTLARAGQRTPGHVILSVGR